MKIDSLSSILLLALTCLAIAGQTARADTPPPNAGIVPSTKLTLAELPPVPKELKQLVEQNELTFLIGGTRPSILNPSRSTGVRGRTFDGETQFRLSYQFNSRCQWDIVKDPARPNTVKQLAIQVRFNRVELVVKHQIWLRTMPTLDTFWESPLVRHEFDHVRISSDSRIQKQFNDSVRKHTRFELSQSQSEPIIALAYRRLNATWFRRGTLLNYLKSEDSKTFVKTKIQTEFDRIVELIEIRYAELDRITNHGRYPVPDTGPLQGWLRTQ